MRTPFNQSVIVSLLKNAEALGLSRSAGLRLQWFLFALEHDWNISLTCRHFGIARTTFVRWSSRFDPYNPSSLEEHSRRPHTMREAQEDPAIVAFVERCRREHPHANKEFIRDLLHSENGVTISASTIGRIIQRHGFFFGSSPAHCAKRSQRNDTPSFVVPITPVSVPTERDEGDARSFDSIPVFGS